MIWRYTRTFTCFDVTIIKKSPSFFPIFHLSTAASAASNSAAADNHGQRRRRRISATTITAQSVDSTLLSCPSDLIALSFFLWCARQPNYFHSHAAFDHMFLVLARLTRKLDQSVGAILKQLESVGCVKKPQNLLLLLRIYWRGGAYDMVFQVFEEMLRYGYTPNTFVRNILMDVLFKIGRPDVALTVLSETQSPNFLSFSIAICNLCKVNDLLNIQKVMRCMLRHGYYLNVSTFSVVLNCFCKLGRLGEAVQLLGLMIALGIPVLVNVWSILIEGFCRCRRIEMAVDLFDRMVQIGCSPNAVTCTSLIKGLMEVHMPDAAFEILRTMESNGCFPDLILCNVVINCLTKMGRYDEAINVFFSFPERKLLPDSFTFCSIISASCLSRQFGLLPSLATGLLAQADLVVCNSLLSYFCKAGHPSLTVEFYNNMIDKGFTPDRYSYAGLLMGLCRAGRTIEAVHVYRGLMMNDFGLDSHIHTVIVDGLIKSGYAHKAIKLFRKAALTNSPLDVVSYTVAINGLFCGDRAGEAYSLYSHMKELGIAPNFHTFNVLAAGFSRKRDVKMVQLIVQEMIDMGIELEYHTFIVMQKFLLKSRHCHMIYDLLVELWESHLLPSKAVYLLFDNGIAQGVNIGKTHLQLLKGRFTDTMDVDLPRSDDLSDDVAAAVG